MDHTVLGRRLNDIEETSKLYNKTNIAVFDLLGDRTYYYLKGWELFVKHPVTGIGLRNFRIKTGSKETMHSEYMVQLAEGGIIGSFLFILFSFWFLIQSI
jgi:O-antigen ligase